MESISVLSLPPGFGFHPTDVELISHYLKRKIDGLKIDSEVIPEVDIYKYEPWDLPAKCRIPTRDSKWHFFTSRDRKYPNGSRSKRATEAGYWKSTGKDRSIRSHNLVIGTKKTLVFYEGRPPCGKRTDWIMHEYYIDENKHKASPSVKGTFVLCRVTKRDGLAFDDENVETGAEDILTSPKPPMTVNNESLSSSGNADEDFDAWFNGLYDPNISEILKLKDEPEISQQDFNSLALNQEPVDLLPEFPEGLQLEGDGTYSILRDREDLGYDVFEEFKIERLDADSAQGFLNRCKMSLSDGDDGDSATFDSFASEELGDDNVYPLVNILKRRIIMPSEEVAGYRSKLKVHKMKSSGGSTHETVKIDNQNHHLDRNDAIQHPAGTKDDAGKCSSALSLDYDVARNSLSSRAASNMSPMRRGLYLSFGLGITALLLYVLQHEMPLWSD